jgi:hypothetical protein
MGAMCSLPGADRPRLVLGFGNLPTRAVRAGVELVADLMHG